MPKSTIFQYRWVYTDGLQWLTSHAAREAFPSGWVCPAERPRSGSTVAEPGGEPTIPTPPPKSTMTRHQIV